jgi:hypothetical protein
MLNDWVNHNIWEDSFHHCFSKQKMPHFPITGSTTQLLFTAQEHHNHNNPIPVVPGSCSFWVGFYSRWGRLERYGRRVGHGWSRERPILGLYSCRRLYMHLWVLSCTVYLPHETGWPILVRNAGQIEGTRETKRRKLDKSKNNGFQVEPESHRSTMKFGWVSWPPKMRKDESQLLESSKNNNGFLVYGFFF